MVTVDSLSFGYGKTRLFDGLDLALEPGNIYGLLGMNGAGKTTLLRLLAGLLFPTGGSLSVLGNVPARRSPEFLADIYYVPEEFTLPAITLGRYEKLYAPFYPRFDHALFADCAREFDLDGKKPLNAFSYGQKKKFIVSFALASGARLVLLDEPTNGLDIPSKSLFRRIVARSLSSERIFVISTHQVRDMESLIDPIIILDSGLIAFNQPLMRVAERLSITEEAEDPGEGAIYAEKGVTGFTVVRENVDGSDSTINLEVLFNAVISNRERMGRMFEEGASREDQ
jgi:ABC-2 type transport system ATP-binding protein